MNLIEPQRWKNLLYLLNNWVFDSAALTQIIPILADIFVFAYPVILVVWYLTGIIKQNHKIKSDALVIFLWAVYATIINIILQFFLHKDRPIFAGDNSIHMILKDLPTASFPSDHAAVSMIFGLAILLIAIRNKNKALKFLSLILVVCSLIMSVSRIAVWVHWPTDILAGWWVAIIVFVLMSIPSVYALQKRYIIRPLITLQEWLFGLVNIKS